MLPDLTKYTPEKLESLRIALAVESERRQVIETYPETIEQMTATLAAAQAGDPE
ncbi:hypothetical protein [Marisediminicola sp. LYQ85]|uniref:hypothetical protein n=1 Tax=Marisediminicola sp. LYQ85 TaxID=3391062 RepID=UPI003982FB39